MMRQWSRDEVMSKHEHVALHCTAVQCSAGHVGSTESVIDDTRYFNPRSGHVIGADSQQRTNSSVLKWHHLSYGNSNSVSMH